MDSLNGCDIELRYRNQDYNADSAQVILTALMFTSYEMHTNFKEYISKKLKPNFFWLRNYIIKGV